MKKLLLITVAIIVGWNACAQFTIPAESVPQIKRENLEVNDLEEVLQGLGLDIFRFSIPADSLRPYKVIFTYDEYAGDSVTISEKIMLGETYLYFTEEQGGPASKHCDNIRIYISNMDETTPKLGLALVGGGYTRTKLEHKTDMPYGTRPFANQQLEENRKIPLVMYGSFWKDRRGFIRFCGSRELTPDDEMLTQSPHYYIINVELQPVE